MPKLAKSFILATVLKRTVIDRASLKVRASSLEHAYDIARNFLDDYPNNTKAYGHDVPFFAIEDRTNLDSEILDLDVEDEIA